MNDFIQQYINLLIKQYFNQPNAKGEIENSATMFGNIKETADELLEQYDIDQATGKTLDLIGALVGIKRTEPEFNDDDTYRFFIKVKIAKNTSSAFMVSQNKTGLQDAIRFAFDNNAYIVDKKNMSLDLYISEEISLNTIELLFRLNLLPKPQGVRYNNVKQLSLEPAFGFSNNPLSRAFASKNDPTYVNGGPFARKIFLNF